MTAAFIALSPPRDREAHVALCRPQRAPCGAGLGSIEALTFVPSFIGSGGQRGARRAAVGQPGRSADGGNFAGS